MSLTMRGITGPRGRLPGAAALLLALALPLGAQEDAGRPPVTKPLARDLLQSLSLGLSTPDLDTLAGQGWLVRRSTRPVSPLVARPELQGPLVADLAKAPGNTLVEVLLVQEGPRSFQGLGPQERSLLLYQTLHRFSTMKGIEYWSASRQAMREFYQASTVITGPQDPRPLPDPVPRSLSPRTRLWLEQTDSSFGKNRWSVDIMALPAPAPDRLTPIWLRISNLGPVWYSVVPILGAGDLNMYLAIWQEGEHLVFWGAAAFPLPPLPGVNTRVVNSLQNRVLALYDWWRKELP